MSQPPEEFTDTTISHWTRSDHYHNQFLLGKDPVLDFVLKNSEDKGLRNIAVTPSQGKLLHLQALAMGAKRYVSYMRGASTVLLTRL